MTAVLDGPQAPAVLPGWNLALDLTPREIVDARRLRRLRKAVAAWLVFVLLVCAAGYVMAHSDSSRASASLTTAEDQTAALHAQQTRYRAVTVIDGTVQTVRGQLAKTFAADVDVTALLTRIRTALPAPLTLSTESLTLANAGSASASSGQTTAQGVVNPTGRPVIGAITLGGTAASFSDVSTYVAALTTIPGVVGLVPTSTQRTTDTIRYSITFAVTDQVLSHRYDLPAKGGR